MVTSPRRTSFYTRKYKIVGSFLSAGVILSTRETGNDIIHGFTATSDNKTFILETCTYGARVRNYIRTRVITPFSQSEL